MMNNYLAQVKDDVNEYINNEINLEEYRGNREELEEQLNDDLWIVDSVTGNGSGSYTFNRAEALEHVMNDFDTVTEALEEFCTPAEEIAKKFLEQDWEYFDVTARCYVLGMAIAEALDELETAGAFDEIEENEDETETAGILDRVAAATQEAADNIRDTFGKDPEPVTA